MQSIQINHAVSEDLTRRKFSLVSGEDFFFSKSAENEISNFKESWEDLEPDRYLQKGATFRERRFGLFSYKPQSNDLMSIEQQTYFQSVDVNQYAGGIQRDFAPLDKEIAEGSFLKSLIEANFKNFPSSPQSLKRAWRVDIHQFRIIGRKHEGGEPTPEGIHQDGDEFNVIHLISRQNVQGGLNSIYDTEKSLLTSTVLEDFMDSAYVWDPYVMHGVSPIHPKDESAEAIRDVLVIGFNFDD